LSKIPLLKPLIVATKSEIRKKILHNSNLHFTYVSSNVDEEKIKKNYYFDNFYDLAIKLASEKSLNVSKKFKNTYVLGVDQVCEFEEKVLSKPGNINNCKKTLKMLSGNTHYQNCGMAVSYNEEIIWTSYDVAKLTMKVLTDDNIDNYIKLDQPFECCGGYKYELNGKNLFSDIKGSIYTIQGLDIDSLFSFLKQNDFI
tara:strand:+ start:756 stop:1352 length:597 start_codon:yes stop_codon:yes gene_type:complete